MRDGLLIAAALAATAWLAPLTPPGQWIDLGHGLALDPHGQVVELATLPKCQ